MRKPFKLFFIFSLLLSTSICFADPAADEQRELEQQILKPINDYYKEISITKEISNYLIQLQIAGAKLTPASAFFQAEEYYAKYAPPNIKELNEIITKASLDSMQNLKNSTVSLQPYVDQVTASWRLKARTCLTDTYLSMFVYQIYKMNQDVKNIKNVKKIKFNFDGAWIIHSKEGTGDHAFILVHGLSGTLFAVDVWGNFVKPLDDSFRHIPGTIAKSNGNIIIGLDTSLNQKVSALFKYKDSKGEYYDLRYINPATTQWLLEVGDSTFIQREILTDKNGSLFQFYTDLQKYAFTSWEPYEEIYPKQALNIAAAALSIQAAKDAMKNPPSGEIKEGNK